MEKDDLLQYPQVSFRMHRRFLQSESASSGHLG